MVQELKLNVPESATDILVFVHGFGVRWDSRGMFTDIEQSLPRSWGKVLFDLYKIESKDVFVTSINEQVQRLSEVLGQLKFNYPDLKVHLLAHSQGCMITALLIGTRLEEYFNNYPGSHKVEGELIVPRRDKTITHIPADYFKQSQNTNVQEPILEYSNLKKINFLHATKDEVLGGVSYKLLQKTKNIEIIELPADHNFTGQSRLELVKYVSQILTG